MLRFSNVATFVDDRNACSKDSGYGFLRPLVLMALASCLSVLAAPERMPLKYYTTADGLPHNAINKIVGDSRGFLWFCTDDGLARFDGYTFTTFGVDQGLPQGAVNDLLETREGQYWVATNAGLVRFEGGRLSDLRASPRTPSAMFNLLTSYDGSASAVRIDVLLEDKEGNLWCGSDNGLCQVVHVDGRDQLRFVDIGIPNQYPDQRFVASLIEDSDGSLWIGTFHGLYHRSKSGHASRFTMRDGLPDELIHSLLRDHAGRLWAGTRSAGFFQFKAGPEGDSIIVPRSFRLRDLIPTGWIFQLFETSDHRFWVAANTGLLEFFPEAAANAAQFRFYGTKNGLSYREVTALAEDTSGNLWLGTNTAGAMKLTHNGFLTYSEQDGIRSANSVFQDGRGDICVRGVLAVSTSTGGEGAPNFGCFDGLRFQPFDLASVPTGARGIGWVLENVTLPRRNGEWWVGAANGIYRFGNLSRFAKIASVPPLSHYTVNDGLGAPQVYRLFEDSLTNVWVSSISSLGNGFARWNEGEKNWTDLSKVPGLPSLRQDLPRSFTEDHNGNIWIGFDSALARYRQNQFHWFRLAEGLPSGLIRNMHCDRDGHLWLASSESGLVRVDDAGSERPRFVKFTTAQGLSSNRTEVIAEDPYGRIYVGTGRALDRLDPNTGRVRHFTAADGLAPGLFRSAYRDRAGALWFGMTGGLSRLEPQPDFPASALPVLVTATAAPGRSRQTFPFGETRVALPELAHNNNELQLDFVALDFTPGEVLRYQYQVAGKAWSSPSEERSIAFAKLAPGSYRIQLRAISSSGAVSAVPASVEFTILPPLWRRWWFVALSVVAAYALAYAGYRYRMAQVLEIANVRGRIARDLHDDIGSNLTKIAILSEVAKQKLGDGLAPGDDPLASIADISRESIASMSDIVWAINPQRDHLIDLVRRMRQHAEQLFAAHEIKLTFHAPGEEQDMKIKTEIRRDFFLIFKEALNNIARHAECSEVTIDFEIRGDRLMLKVGDNGVGFDPRAMPDGLGLASMRKRAERLGGAFEISTSGAGNTKVQLVLPVKGPTRPTPTGR